MPASPQFSPGRFTFQLTDEVSYCLFHRAGNLRGHRLTKLEAATLDAINGELGREPSQGTGKFHACGYPDLMREMHKQPCVESLVDAVEATYGSWCSPTAHGIDDDDPAGVLPKCHQLCTVARVLKGVYALSAECLHHSRASTIISAKAVSHADHEDVRETKITHGPRAV